jgi:hypothetical protein
MSEFGLIFFTLSIKHCQYIVLNMEVYADPEYLE